MEIFTANEAKNRFGEVLLKSQKAPVQVTRSGKPIAMIVSIEDYNATEELKLRYVGTSREKNEINGNSNCF